MTKEEENNVGILNPQPLFDRLTAFPSPRPSIKSRAMPATGQSPRDLLQTLARKAMLGRGLLPDFSAAALAEIARITAPTPGSNVPGNDAIRDLRDLLWASIDNDDSRDLDQLTVAEALSDGKIKVLVAIADVDAVISGLAAIDEHARHNTTSVYTAAKIFPMLPEKLSTDITSLGHAADRQAIIVEMAVLADGSVESPAVYRAWVRNQAKLAYNSVAAWLEGGPPPAALAAVPGLDANLRLQDKAAQALKARRQAQGALTFETLQTRATFDGDQVHDLELDKPNRAKHLIEDFMVAANRVTAEFLEGKKFPCVRRVVRVPKRWDRIVEVAQQHGCKLPREPDARALSAFLAQRKAADAVRFPDLSLAVIKLLGPGEYVAEKPGEASPAGHFALAVEHYSHSTAPNRRYPDVITQRLLKAALANRPIPYEQSDLEALAVHCTAQEDAAKKVERQVGKSAAAMLLQGKIGQRFDGIVTGASEKGTWVRIFSPPVEGKLVQGSHGADVGHKIQVKLLRTNVEHGFIDFGR
jgi:VacB/RNase II family 3'-5' exoribonuclease